ncbi:MAG: tetratricopeptide repeat protein [Actinobacteria bacterium]|nr:tetratricopeptide repeat protein [Actinomycetota bacterium]
MVVLSREAFDAIEFEAAYSGNYRPAAEQMTRLADTGTQSPSMPRSEAYLRAGEQWLLADDPAAAANAFMRALADGGPASIDPRAPLARALFLLGRADEAEAHIRDLGLAPPRDPRLCDQIAELLVERSELERALAWATAGVDLCLGGQPGPIGQPGPAGTSPAGTSPGEPSPPGERPPLPGGDRTELRLLLTLRYRIRNDLGLPEDTYDQLLDELLSETGNSAAGD